MKPNNLFQIFMYECKKSKASLSHVLILPNAAAMAWWSMEGCESAVGRSGRV